MLVSSSHVPFAAVEIAGNPVGPENVGSAPERR